MTPSTTAGQDTPVCVFRLADHLDAALAAGEDLVAVGQVWDDGDPSDPGVAGTQRWAIGRLRVHEMTLLSRVLLARDYARQLAQVETRFKPLAHLFVSGTADLKDAAGEACDVTACAFENGEDATAYLRARGLVDRQAAGLLPGQSLDVGDNFIVLGRLPLGILLDLVAEFLEALDAHFDLYPDETPVAVPANVGVADDEDSFDDEDMPALQVGGVDPDAADDAADAERGDEPGETPPVIPGGVLTVAGSIPAGGKEGSV